MKAKMDTVKLEILTYKGQELYTCWVNDLGIFVEEAARVVCSDKEQCHIVNVVGGPIAYLFEKCGFTRVPET